MGVRDTNPTGPRRKTFDQQTWASLETIREHVNCFSATRDRDVLGRPIVGSCWLFDGPVKAQRAGYVKIKFRFRDREAKESAMLATVALSLLSHDGKKPPISWRLEGDEDNRLSGDHLCCNPACVSPYHLEAVSVAENNRRMWMAKLESRGGLCSKMLHTLAEIRADGTVGSSLPDAYYISPNGARRCRACALDDARRGREGKSPKRKLVAVDAVRALLDSGLSATSTAKKLQCHPSTIYTLCKRAGISLRHPGRSFTDGQLLQDLSAHHKCPLRERAARLGCSIPAVQRGLIRLKESKKQ